MDAALVKLRKAQKSKQKEETSHGHSTCICPVHNCSLSMTTDMFATVHVTALHCLSQASMVHTCCKVRMIHPNTPCRSMKHRMHCIAIKRRPARKGTITSLSRHSSGFAAATERYNDKFGFKLVSLSFGTALSHAVIKPNSKPQHNHRGTIKGRLCNVGHQCWLCRFSIATHQLHELLEIDEAITISVELCQNLCNLNI